MERIQIFSLIEDLKIEFLGIFKQREQFGAKFVERCVDFDVAYLLVNLVQRLLYRSVLL